MYYKKKNVKKVYLKKIFFLLKEGILRKNQKEYFINGKKRCLEYYFGKGGLKIKSKSTKNPAKKICTAEINPRRHRFSLPEDPKVRYLLLVIFAILLFLNMVKPCLAAGSSGGSDDPFADLSMTFVKIIKCAGYITFILGYADFAASLQGGDTGTLLTPGKKMFAGIILSQSNWFLRSVGVWDAISSGTPVPGISSVVNTLCTITSSIIVGLGVVSLISGVQKFFGSFHAHDMTSMLASMRTVFSGLLVSCSAGVATFLDVTLNVNSNRNIKNVVNRGQTVIINVASGIAVGVGVVVLIQGVQSFFAGRDAHDTQGAIQNYVKIFIGLGMAASGGIAFFLVNIL